MAAAPEDMVTGRKSGLQRALTHWPLNVFLILMGLFWMTPTFGLFITSFREGSDSAATGWWNVFTEHASSPSSRTRTCCPMKAW